MGGAGRVVSANQVRQALTDTLRHWLPFYLAEVARADGIASVLVPVPKEWREPQTASGLPRIDQVPLVVVTCEGAGDYERTSDEVDAVFAASVDLLVRGGSEEQTTEYAAVYGTAVRVVLEQRRDLGRYQSGMYVRGFAADTRVTGERYGEYLDEAQQRTLGVAVVRCAVTVAAVHQRYADIATPPADPHQVSPGTPTVLTTDVTVEPLED